MEVMRSRCGRDLTLRFDLIGQTSVLADDAGRMFSAAPQTPMQDVRLRVAGKHDDMAVVDRLLREVTALWTGGPAGGGGVRVAKRQRLSMRSCLVAREAVPAGYSFLD